MGRGRDAPIRVALGNQDLLAYQEPGCIEPGIHLQNQFNGYELPEHAGRLRNAREGIPFVDHIAFPQDRIVMRNLVGLRIGRLFRGWLGRLG